VYIEGENLLSLVFFYESVRMRGGVFMERGNSAASGKTARVVAVREIRKDKAVLVLEGAPFRPSGGGQPGDSGTLRGENFLARVVDCHRENGFLVVPVCIEAGILREGMSVETEIDMERRSLLSRMHTGEHLLSRVLEDAREGLQIYKVAIGEEESTVYVRYDGIVDWEMLFAAEERANGLVASGLAVEISELTREEARSLPRLKANWDRLEDDRIRVVSIPDVDVIACSGTHVERTDQVGRLFVTGYGGSVPEWEFTFTVHGESRLAECGKVLRRLSRRIGCPVGEIEKVYDRVQEERGTLAKILDKVKPYLDFPWEEESLQGIPFCHAAVPALPRDLATAPVKRLVTERPDSLVLALLPSGSDAPFPFVLARGSVCPVDCRELIRDESVMAKGGGSADWVMGVTRCAIPAVWRRALTVRMVSRHN